jgi:hypothetical protein
MTDRQPRTEQDIRIYDGKSTIWCVSPRGCMWSVFSTQICLRRSYGGIQIAWEWERRWKATFIYIPDQLNTFFATPQTVWPSYTDFDSAYDSPTEELAFINTFELLIYNYIDQIRSNGIVADVVPIKFQKIILPHILPYVTYVFNTVLTSSSYPASWKLSKSMPVAKNNDSRL